MRQWRWRRGAAAAIALLSLPFVGCAAMVRTWSFAGEPVADAQLSVTLSSAEVKQRNAYVLLEIRNVSDQPTRVEVGTMTMRLPDGTKVEGKTNLAGRMQKAALNKLADWGLWEGKEDPGLPPGDALVVKLAFHAPRRDLRRQERLLLELSAIKVNGKPVTLPAMTLTPPPEAPIGEDI